MIDPNAPLREYTDEYISIKYPGNLECEVSDGLASYVFVQPGRRRNAMEEELSVEVMGASFADVEGFVRRERRRLLSPSPQVSKAMQLSVIRSQETALRDDAVEYVYRIAWNDGRIQYGWKLLFRADERAVYVRILSTGDFATAEPYWRQVIESITVYRADCDTPKPSDTPPRVRRDWTLKRVEQLRDILANLPTDLRYLEDSLLDIAAQPRHLQDSGDIDTSCLEAVVATRLDGLSRREAILRLSRDRQELDNWLRTARRTKQNVRLLEPVAFMIGSLLNPAWVVDEVQRSEE